MIPDDNKTTDGSDRFSTDDAQGVVINPKNPKPPGYPERPPLSETANPKEGKK